MNSPVQWYLIHTKPRQERTALANLQQQGYGLLHVPVRLRKNSLGCLEGRYRAPVPQVPLYPARHRALVPKLDAYPLNLGSEPIGHLRQPARQGER